MNDYRRRLIVALRDSKLEALNDVTEELGMASGRTGRETMGGEVLDFWKPVMYNPQNRSATKLFFLLASCPLYQPTSAAAQRHLS